jgi:hypothetical protein
VTRGEPRPTRARPAAYYALCRATGAVPNLPFPASGTARLIRGTATAGAVWGVARARGRTHRRSLVSPGSNGSLDCHTDRAPDADHDRGHGELRRRDRGGRVRDPRFTARRSPTRVCDSCGPADGRSASRGAAASPASRGSLAATAPFYAMEEIVGGVVNAGVPPPLDMPAERRRLGLGLELAECTRAIAGRAGRSASASRRAASSVSRAAGPAGARSQCDPRS